MNIGIFLQYLGVIIAVIGFIVAGKTGHSELQVPALIVGIVISVIGFLKHVGTPVKEQKKTRSEEYSPRYITKAEKNRTFFKKAIYYALLGAVVWYSKKDDFPEYPEVIFIIPAMCAFSLLVEACIIYRKTGNNE